VGLGPLDKAPSPPTLKREHYKVNPPRIKENPPQNWKRPIEKFLATVLVQDAFYFASAEGIDTAITCRY